MRRLDQNDGKANRKERQISEGMGEVRMNRRMGDHVLLSSLENNAVSAFQTPML